MLANNLANANTAGFKRSDVNFESSLASALGSSDPASTVAGLSFQPQTDTTSPAQADGNNVDMETEMSGLTENAVYLAKGRVLRRLRQELQGLLD